MKHTNFLTKKYAHKSINLNIKLVNNDLLDTTLKIKRFIGHIIESLRTNQTLIKIQSLLNIKLKD